MRNAFAKALLAIARSRPNVYCVVADISPAGAMDEFRAEFPKQFVNVGVSEQAMVSVAAGLALRGCKVFCYTIAPFAVYRPFEQIRVDVCYQNLPVTIVGMGAGLCYGTLGGTHHATEDVAVMSALPNMSVIAPCDPLETEAATWACADHPGPTYLRLGKSGEPVLTDKAIERFQFGKLRWMRSGEGVCILSYGPIMRLAMEVAERLGAAVYNVPTLKPLDFVRLASIGSGDWITVVIDEHIWAGGLGEHAFACMTKHPLCFTVRGGFTHTFGTQDELWRHHGLYADSIEAAIRARMNA